MSASTPGPWEWWTSNSWRRLRSNPSNGRDVGVCVPFVASDGHPDLEVRSADMALIAAAPDLLALAHKFASECSECGGSGEFRPYVGNGEFGDVKPCPDCADIRAVIAKAEGRACFREGQRVRYVPMHAQGNFNHVDCEDGVVTSVNRQFVFVRYDGQHRSQATLPTDLMPL